MEEGPVPDLSAKRVELFRGESGQASADAEPPGNVKSRLVPAENPRDGAQIGEGGLSASS